MVRVSSMGGSSPDIDTINLSRLVDRLQQNILKSEPSTEHRLRRSPYERRKVGVNVEYAKDLLRRLEQDAANIKVLSRKQDAQADLLRNRDVLNKVSSKLQELNDTAIELDDDDSEGEDLLGGCTPSDDTGELENHAQPQQTLWEASQAQPPLSEPTQPQTDSRTTEREELFPSTIRSRGAQSSATTQDTAQSSSTDAHVTPLHEKLLSHNRTEQESLTESMLSLAQALKASSQAISNSLDEDADIVNRAVDGIERNTTGLDAAQRSMGYLRKMSEGKGWWGRMMLYAWIFGLMFLAFFIVAFMPKLRF